MMDDNVPGFVSHKKEHAGTTQGAARPKSGKRQGILVFAVVLLAGFLAASFLAARVASAQQSIIQTNASTQFLFGEDALDGDQNILAQYMRINLTPKDKNIAVSGYGRVWKDFGDPAVQTNDGTGRLYYLYLDYAPAPVVSFRAGRQWVNYTAGTAVLDGLTANVDLSKVSRAPIGVSLSGGQNVIYTLDGEDTRSDNLFFGIDVHLVNSMLTQLGLSYVQTYDESDRAQQEFGLNFRRTIGPVSPWGEVRYNRIANLIDEADLGVDYFPSLALTLKGEYYYFYPQFDATSIYSVFAVDKYQEGRFEADYNLEQHVSFPVTVFGSFSYQDYDEDSTADVVKLGARVSPAHGLSLSGDVNSQEGFAGHLIGFELDGDYRPATKLQVNGGVSFETYRRPIFITPLPGETTLSAEQSYYSATSVFLGSYYQLRKSLSIGARLEEDIDPMFSHVTEGRIMLNYQI